MGEIDQLWSAQAKAFISAQHSSVIDGRAVTDVGTAIPVHDPATGKVITELSEASAAHVDQAVRSARTALESPSWARMAPAERQRLIWQLSVLIERDAALLAEIESIDNGKTRFMASVADIPMARDYLRYMAGWATKVMGQTFDVSIDAIPGARYHAYTRREPVGVVAQIIPWNFPLLMAIWKLAPALAAGCTCVLKPAEQTSLTALYLAKLVEEAGFPVGVVNILIGRGSTTGNALVRNPGVDKIAFTGSTAIGKAINVAATDDLKRVTLELGGKSPMIVLADCDPDIAAMGAAQACFFNHGQVCTAGSRLFVHSAIYDAVLERVAAGAGAVKLGPGLDARTEMGPLVSAQQRDRVMAFIEGSVQEGGSIAAGGETAFDQGYFVKPTVIANVSPDMRVVREEVFGPVLTVQRFDEIDAVIAAANDSKYGLAASVWSNDLAAVHEIVPQLKAGTVWVNAHNLVDPAMPFGGYKQSGVGREHGQAAIEAHTELKSVCMHIG